MSARPQVRVHGANGQVGKVNISLPTVFLTPIRADLVQSVHTNMNKNRRQAYAVSEEAGHQTSAESWGTGRAVARIPRVPGGGTHRAGQGAFGNMCRGGRMFAPTKTWRRWHRKSNLNQRRYAVASALAASAVPALVMARGHRINRVEEVPVVVADEAFAAVKKTKDALTMLKKVHAFEDVQKAVHSKKLRAGVGKIRNRRFRRRRGPLVVYTDKSAPFVRAFRNIPGVETLNVNRLNLLRLAPGGHLGRFIVWTQDAFGRLDRLFGTHRLASSSKHGYNLPRAVLANADINRIINSDEVQSALRRPRKQLFHARRKQNPLTNMRALKRINPYAIVEKRNRILAQKRTIAARAKAVTEKRKYNPRAGQAVRKLKKGKDGKEKKPMSKQLFHKLLVKPAANKDSPFN